MKILCSSTIHERVINVGTARRDATPLWRIAGTRVLRTPPPIPFCGHPSVSAWRACVRMTEGGAGLQAAKGRGGQTWVSAKYHTPLRREREISRDDRSPPPRPPANIPPCATPLTAWLDPNGPAWTSLSRSRRRGTSRPLVFTLQESRSA